MQKLLLKLEKKFLKIYLNNKELSIAFKKIHVESQYGNCCFIPEQTKVFDLDSNDLSNAVWVKTNVTVSANTAEVVDPAGGNTAEKLLSTAANGTVTQTVNKDINNDDGCYSVWLCAKAQATDNVTIRIKDHNNTVKATDDITVTPTWQRFILSYTNAGADTDHWKVEIELNNDADTIYHYESQLEVAVLYETQNIPTGALGDEIITAGDLDDDNGDFEGAGADGTDIETGTDWTKSNCSAETDNEAGSGVNTYNGSDFCCKLHTATGNSPHIIISGADLDSAFGEGEIYEITIQYKTASDGVVGSAVVLKDGDGTTLLSETLASATWTESTFVTDSPVGNVTGMKLYLYLENGTDEDGDEILFVDNVSIKEIGDVRQEESLYYTITNNLQIGHKKGSFAFWIKPWWLQSTDTDNTRVFIHVVDSGGDTVFRIFKAATTNYITFAVYDPGNVAIESSVIEATDSLTQNDWTFVVVTYDMNTANSTKIYIDSVLKVTGTYSPGLPGIPSKIYVGSDDTPANFMDAVIDDLLIYKDVLDQGWVTNAYASSKSLGIRKNYWSALVLDDKTFKPIRNVGQNKYDFNLKAKEVLT